MRIKFLKDTPVEISTLPPECYGQAPMFAKKDGSMGHRFRAGTISDLPEDLATAYIASGAAEFDPNERDVKWVAIELMLADTGAKT